MCVDHLAPDANAMLTVPRAVYADPRYWRMELFPSPGQNIVCDGSAAVPSED